MRKGQRNLKGESVRAQVISSHGRHHIARDAEGRTFEAHRRGKFRVPSERKCRHRGSYM